MTTYIIGHKKPDLDSVVSAIALSNYFLEIDKTTSSVNSYTPSIVEVVNPETDFVFKKFNAVVPPILSSADITAEDKVILVDHNEPEQRLDNLNPNQIVGIYDHHKVNLSLVNPIEIHTFVMGSTNTIIWTMFKKSSLEINSQTAALMLCSILSDTVGLKSSTTTKTDREAVDDLVKTAKVADLNALIHEIFKAKSNISSLTDDQVVLNDYKIFEFSGKKVLIGQIETVEQNELLSTRKDKLLEAMARIKTQQAVDYLFLTVTDILAVNSKLLLLGGGESDLALKAFPGTINQSVLDIGALLSRKKDIAPKIEQAIIS